MIPVPSNTRVWLAAGVTCIHSRSSAPDIVRVQRPFWLAPALQGY